MNNEMAFEPMVVTVNEFGTGFVRNIIHPYYFIEFENGIKRVVHEDKVVNKVNKIVVLKGEKDV